MTLHIKPEKEKNIGGIIAIGVSFVIAIFVTYWIASGNNNRVEQNKVIKVNDRLDTQVERLNEHVVCISFRPFPGKNYNLVVSTNQHDGWRIEPGRTFSFVKNGRPGFYYLSAVNVDSLFFLISEQEKTETNYNNHTTIMTE